MPYLKAKRANNANAIDFGDGQILVPVKKNKRSLYAKAIAALETKDPANTENQ